MLFRRPSSTHRAMSWYMMRGRVWPWASPYQGWWVLDSKREFSTSTTTRSEVLRDGAPRSGVRSSMNDEGKRAEDTGSALRGSCTEKSGEGGAASVYHHPMLHSTTEGNLRSAMPSPLSPFRMERNTYIAPSFSSFPSLPSPLSSDAVPRCSTNEIPDVASTIPHSTLSSLSEVEMEEMDPLSSSFDWHIQEGLRQQLCHPTNPIPYKAVYLQLCHCYRLMEELYHTTTSRRLSKLRGALRFLRRHNVLLHGILFYVPKTPSDVGAGEASIASSSLSSALRRNEGLSSSSWNVTSEFTRLRLFGEAFLHAELRTRLLKLLPDLPTEVFVEALQRCTSPESYAALFDQLQLEFLVGARPPKPPKLLTKVRRRQEKSPSTAPEEEGGEHQQGRTAHQKEQDIAGSTPRVASPFLAPSAEDRVALQVARRRYRQQYSFTSDEKASMVCAILGELRWFGCRTRPTHRTHNNAIFPPSDVLILHVLATHVVECLPAEMLYSLLHPSLEAIKRRWANISASLPSQLPKRFTPSPSRYRLALEPCSAPQAAMTTTTGSTERDMKSRMPTPFSPEEEVLESAQAIGKEGDRASEIAGNEEEGSRMKEEQVKRMKKSPGFPAEAEQGDASVKGSSPASLLAQGVPAMLPLSMLTADLSGRTFSFVPVPAHTGVIQSRVQPKVHIRGIKGGASSAHFRVYTRNGKEFSRDALFCSEVRTSGDASSFPSLGLKGVEDRSKLAVPAHQRVETVSSERRREILSEILY